MAEQMNVLHRCGEWIKYYAKNQRCHKDYISVTPFAATWMDLETITGFPNSSVRKEFTCKAGDPVQFLGQEDLLEEGWATHSSFLGLPLWLSWQRICLQCGRPGFNPWVGKIPLRRESLPIPVFWPGEFHEL